MSTTSTPGILGIIAAVLSGVHAGYTASQCATPSGGKMEAAKNVFSAARGFMSAATPTIRKVVDETGKLANPMEEIILGENTNYHRNSAIVLIIIFALLVTGKTMTKKTDEDASKVADALYTTSLSVLAVLVAITISNSESSPSCSGNYATFKFALLLLLFGTTLAAAIGSFSS